MNTPVITALATYVPATVTLRQWYRIDRARCAVPLAGWADHVYPDWFAAYGLDLRRLTQPLAGRAATLASLAATGIGTVPLERDLDLSGLAAHVARAVCAAPDRHTPRIDIAMFCHSSIDEHVSTTAAGRLRAVIAQPCFPFSLAQQQGASILTALEITADLFTAEPALRGVLIVGAEKWCHPFARRIGHWTLQGDAAGAMLVERAALTTHGLRLLGTTVQPLADARAPFGLPDSLARANASFAGALAGAIDSLLQQHHVHANEIAAVIAHRVNQPLVDTVLRHLGIASDRCVRDERAYLGAAETIVRLSETLRAVELPNGLLLAWAVGLGGYVGCALLEARGTPCLRTVNGT